MIPIENVKRLCVRMPNWIGDAVMGLPVLQDIFEKNSKLEIDVICHKAIGDLLENNPYVRNRIIYSKKDSKKKIRESIVTELKKNKYEVGVLLTRSFSSAYWFFQGKIPHRIGFKDHYRSLFLRPGIDVPKNEEFEHQIITYKRLLEPLSIPISSTMPKLYLQTEEIDNARKILTSYNVPLDAIIIGINPGAAYGSAKCWPPDHFKALVKLLIQNPKVYVVFFGDDLSKDLCASITLDFQERVLNLSSKTTLRELIALTSLCSCFITNDSGPMHIASSLECNVVAIFGSTNPIKTGPYGNAKVIKHDVACSPCYKRKCPIDFRCMNSIFAETVYLQVLEFLKNMG